jgi:hypothetical protein
MKNLRTNVLMKSCLGAALVGLSLSVAACGAVDPDGNPVAFENGDEEVASVSEALTKDFTTPDGRVTVRIKQCGFSATPASHSSANCAVDSDFVLVGGGAEVEGNGQDSALLTESYPSEGLDTWIAKSKDHVDIYLNRLRAYAIGLKIKDISATTLRNNMVRIPKTSAQGHWPTAVAELPDGYQLIGGGARSIWSTKGLLLTASFPQPGGIAWEARAKDHVLSEQGWVEAFAIGIKKGFSGINLEVVTDTVTEPTGGGYVTAERQLRSGYVSTSIGALSEWSGSGRLLTDMIPFSNYPDLTRMGAYVTSKDHEVATSGSVTAYVLGVKRL